MTDTRNQRHRLLLALYAVATLMCAAPYAGAQTFEYIYGCPCAEEAGRKGVAPVSEGGYISVGETFTVADPPDIYVVRTQDDGTLAWAKSYDIGDHDSATDIEEVFQMVLVPRHDTVEVGWPPPPPPPPQFDTTWVFDGFIVTGVTRWNIQPPPGDTLAKGRTDRDLFLMRIDRCGVLRWTYTYGTDSTDEIGYDLKVLASGGGGTNINDIIVAGSTTKRSGAGNGPRDAYLLRTDQFGNIIWDRTYDVNSRGKDDWFYGVTEAFALKQAGLPADIVAVGGTTAYDTTKKIDALIVRVNATNGLITAMHHGMIVYGDDDDEDLRDVEELKRGMVAGNLAVIGRTLSYDNGSSDVFVMRTAADPNNPFAQYIFGETDDDDEGYDLREISSGPYEEFGNLMTTGYVTLDNGLGGKDAFLQKLNPITLAPMGMMHFYGGTGTDWGWSLHDLGDRTDNGMLRRTDGFIMCGFTQSDRKGNSDPRDLYLVKTNTQLESKCDEDSTEIPSTDIAMNWEKYTPRFGDIRRRYDVTPTPRCETDFDTLCLDLDGTTPKAIPACPDCQPVPDPDDTSQHLPKMPAPGVDMGIDGPVITQSYPNPVHRGNALNLRCDARPNTLVTIGVSDINGHEVYRWTGPINGRGHAVVVDTKGWPVGAYVVTIADGARSSSARVVLVDR